MATKKPTLKQLEILLLQETEKVNNYRNILINIHIASKKNKKFFKIVDKIINEWELK